MLQGNTKGQVSGDARESHLDFLYDLYKQGIEIGNDNIALLKKHKRIKEEAPQKKEPLLPVDNINTSLLKFSTEASQKTDTLIDIVESSGPATTNHEIFSDNELESRRKLYGHKFEGRDHDIRKEEWMPKSTTEHEEDFIDWINSINNLGFKFKINYRKFSLYCQQAYTWLQENKSPTDFDDDDEREDFKQEELRRCDINSLYFLNKYVYYKEGDSESGREKYVARPVHEVMAYLDDCGYSVGIAKGRQIAATTTLMALDVKDVIFKPNHFMKFITEDVDKAEEIFEDKLKFAFSQLPAWMRPNVLNERDNLFKIGYKQEKGKKEGVGSKIEISAPKRTAIAGGAPQKVKIDEAGNIGVLGIMIGNLRPTMMWFNPVTKKIEIKRRLWFWGTGGEMDKGGKAFETELMTIMNQWKEGDYSSCIIPLFFDWTCRPGATQEDYDREKRVAYAKGQNNQDPDAKKHITEFHQTWPTSISDVFRTSAVTLVDEEYIEAALKRIQEEKAKNNFQLHQSGYFEPIFDTNIVTAEGSDVPYKIIGSNFVPTEDIDRRATTTIFMHPKEGWYNRYFKGTDPIDTDTGASKMASTVWDKYYKCPVAILNWRTKDYEQVFLQSLLLNLYYDTSNIKKGIPELVESNRGTSYTQYVKYKGYEDFLVLNYQLPMALQNKSTINEGVGIDNKGIRNDMIINNIHASTKAFGSNYYFELYFEQLKTFTCIISKTGKHMWGPVNKKHYNDDVLFATGFSYICAEQCFPELQPIDFRKESAKHVVGRKLVRDKNLKLKRVTYKKKAA